MKIERLHEYVIPVVAISIALAIAIYCGKLSGGGQMGALSLIALCAILAVLVLRMKEQIWLLLPLFWGFTGRISILPLPFSVSNIAVFFVFTAFLVFRALKVHQRKLQIEWLDLLAGANLLWLVFVFIRNPVGISALNAARVGGRPYFEIAIAVLAYSVLARVKLLPSQKAILPILILGGALIQAFIAGLTYTFPSTVSMIAPFYSGVVSDDYELGGGPGFERPSYLATIATPWMLTLFACLRPLTVINPLHLGRFILFIVGMAMVFLSGFRSIVFLSGVYFLLGGYIRRGWKDVFNSLCIGLPVLSLLIALNGRVINLPVSAQRALSFLPGNWSYEAKRDAEYSTQWRLEMWKETLRSDKYIKSRWFGDGFGFDARDYQTLTLFTRFGRTTGQEEMLLVGGVHSGPLSAIRYIGYVGLVLYMALLISMAKEAWWLARQAHNTQFGVTVLFISMPIIYAPFEFVLVYGALDYSFPLTLYSLGMLKLLKNTLGSMQEPQILSETSVEKLQRPLRQRLVTTGH